MFDSTILDVAAGLVFTFLAVSLAASAATEAWATVMKWRSTTLLKGIKDLLNDRDFNDLAQGIYTHALVNPLDNGTPKTQAQVLKNKPPAYIDPPHFAQALMQHIGMIGADMSPAAIKQRIQNVGNQQFRTLLSGIVDLTEVAGNQALDTARNQIQQQIAAGPMRDALTNVVNRVADPAHPMTAADIQASLPEGPTRDVVVALATLVENPNGQLTPAAVRQQIQTIGDPQLKSMLNSIVDNAAGSVDKIRDEIATWFDHSMDRVSGSYKRWTQLYNFIFALIVTIVLNISAIHVGATLWKQPMLTKSLPSLVDGLTKKPAPSAGGASASAPTGGGTGGVTPTPATGGNASAPPAGSGNTSDKPAPDSQQLPGLKSTLDALNTLSLPIGWDNIGDQVKVCYVEEKWSWSRACALDVAGFPLGWLITAFATLFGAPFWFDLLQSLIRLKGSGPSPQEKKTGAAASA